MRVITAPDEATPADYEGYPAMLFVSGGITGAPNWQPQFIDRLRYTDLLVFNPRRPEFDVRDPNNAVAQIKWEADRLAAADAISFWFPAETLCPITLYELGRWTPEVVVGICDGKPIIRKKRLFIGVHPEYARRADVEAQTKLARPEVTIAYSIDVLAGMVERWAKEVENSR